MACFCDKINERSFIKGEIMDERKVGNKSQFIFAKDIVIDNKNCILVMNGNMNVLFNKDNALDVVWVKYKGVNLSFLSKNGLNDGARKFRGNFEGGFLYTCGMDNVSGCVKDAPVHGSLHAKKCDKAYSYEKDGSIVVYGEVKECALFGKNLLLKREYTVTENDLIINDTVVNEDYKPVDYTFLYHINYGYPFLDEGLTIDMKAETSEPVNETSKAYEKDMFKITAPIDGGVENIFYHTLKEGSIKLTNKNVGIQVEMVYDVNDFPYLVEWKAMVSGDYALGIEPSFTRFDNFQTKSLQSKESRSHKIEIRCK